MLPEIELLRIAERQNSLDMLKTKEKEIQGQFLNAHLKRLATTNMSLVFF
ncbi:hypothetical protein GCM10027286_16210 [Virgibacillus ainsalahensis]